MDVNSGIALAAVFIGAAIWGPIGAPRRHSRWLLPSSRSWGTYGHRYELVPQLEAPELADDEDDDEDDEDDDEPDVEGPGPGPGAGAASSEERAADVGSRRVAEPSVRSDDSAPVLSRPTSPS